MNSRNEGCNSEFWWQILFDENWLGLPTNVLDLPRRTKTNRAYIEESLLSAAKAMGSSGEVHAYSQLLHTASSLVLLECDRTKLYETLKSIKDNKLFDVHEPTVVVTAAALYFIVRELKIDDINRDKIHTMRDRLNQMSWFSSPKTAEILNIVSSKQTNNSH